MGAKVDLSTYKNATVISNLKNINDFKFFADCYMKDNEHFKLIKISNRLKIAENLLNKYRTAELVITSRLCSILPCRAFDTDCIFIHKKYIDDPRFCGLKNIINGDTIMHNKRNGSRFEILNIRTNFLLFKI